MCAVYWILFLFFYDNAMGQVIPNRRLPGACFFSWPALAWASVTQQANLSTGWVDQSEIGHQWAGLPWCLCTLSESATGAADELAFNERTHSVTSSSRYPLQFSKRKPGHTQIVEWEPMRKTEPRCHWLIRSLIAKLIKPAILCL